MSKFTRRSFFGLVAALPIPLMASASVPRIPVPTALSMTPGGPFYPLNSEEKVMAWLAVIEREIGVGSNIGDRAICPETGTPYVELLWTPDGGVDFQHYGEGRAGGSVAARFETAELAWATWAAAFDWYRRGREGKLYWRVKPEVAEIWEGITDEKGWYTGQDKPSGRWRAYARLVIAPER